jgi:hypothetical protein
MRDGIQGLLTSTKTAEFRNLGTLSHKIKCTWEKQMRKQNWHCKKNMNGLYI